jgi:Protein of unknown function (DUF3592)
MKYVLTWLSLACIVAVVAGYLDLPSYRRMAARGVPGSATVVELTPQFHNTLRYEYQVAERTFQGQMQSRTPNLPLERLRVGQSVVVYFDPANPSDSVLGDPKPMLANEIESVAVLAVVFPSFIVLVWAMKASPKRLFTFGKHE